MTEELILSSKHCLIVVDAPLMHNAIYYDYLNSEYIIHGYSKRLLNAFPHFFKHPIFHHIDLKFYFKFERIVGISLIRNGWLVKIYLLVCLIEEIVEFLESI